MNEGRFLYLSGTHLALLLVLLALLLEDVRVRVELLEDAPTDAPACEIVRRVATVKEGARRTDGPRTVLISELVVVRTAENQPKIHTIFFRVTIPRCTATLTQRAPRS